MSLAPAMGRQRPPETIVCETPLQVAHRKPAQLALGTVRRVMSVRRSTLLAPRTGSQSMLLKSFHDQKYRNVLDSTQGAVQVDVACLAGMNESGKSAMLDASTA